MGKERQKKLIERAMSRREFLRFSGAGLAGTALLGAAGCGSGTSGGDNGAEQQSVTLSVGHVFPENDYLTEAGQKFAEEVNKRSGGSVKLNISPAGQLGGDVDMVEGLGLGTLDMWIGGGGILNVVSPLGFLFFTPFTFDSLKDGMEAFDGEYGKKIFQRFKEETDVVALSSWARGPRQLTMNEPAKNPSAVSGKKLRVPENDIALKTWKAIGANPTPLPFPDVYTALDEGVVDGQENPLALIQSSGFSQVQSHLMLTSHAIEPAVVTISDRAWSKLSKQQQTAMTEAAKGTAKKYADQTAAEQEMSLRKKLEKEGMTLVEVDRDAYLAKTAGVVEDNYPKIADLYSMVAPK